MPSPSISRAVPGGSTESGGSWSVAPMPLISRSPPATRWRSALGAGRRPTDSGHRDRRSLDKPRGHERHRGAPPSGGDRRRSGRLRDGRRLEDPRQRGGDRHRSRGPACSSTPRISQAMRCAPPSSSEGSPSSWRPSQSGSVVHPTAKSRSPWRAAGPSPAISCSSPPGAHREPRGSASKRSGSARYVAGCR